ncbi:hypothetical protein [Altericroceibacterium indicum]|uniref:hypothetical protein n=1 Tax=Altericroceibacterium indicum TaxID=374177 RepID=UPI003CCCBB59
MICQFSSSFAQSVEFDAFSRQAAHRDEEVGIDRVIGENVTLADVKPCHSHVNAGQGGDYTQFVAMAAFGGKSCAIAASARIEQEALAPVTMECENITHCFHKQLQLRHRPGWQNKWWEGLQQQERSI